MPTLVFKIAADYEAVIRLREEISKLEAQLKKMDVNKSPVAAKALETQLASTRQQMMGLVTEAAKTGAEMENGFKKKIYDASQTVNGLSEKIIAQRAVIKDIEFDVKRLGDAYRTALKNNPIGASGKLAEYNAARKALDEEKAALFGLTQQQAEARLSVKKLRDEYSLYKKEAGETVDVTKQIKQAVTDMGKKFLGGYGIKELVSQIVRVRGEFQSMQTAIETMVGKDMADSLMSQLKEMAKISPLTLTDMVDAEKMMLGFNIQAEDTVRYLQALSDISMGDSVKFKSLTLAFSQMSAAGKLMGQDLNQMINAGFNPLQIIAEKTGKSISTLKDEMSKGAVSAEMVQQAFIDATSAGGKFYQMSENASKTINGQLSMMQDALDNAFNEMGQASEGVIMEGIQLTTTLIQNYETVGKVLVGLVATYGTYRTAVMLATAATSKHTIAEIALTNARVLARKAQMALNAAMLTNPYVAVATAVAALVAAMWTLSDSTSAASKATKEYNQAKEEAAKKDEEHKRKIEELLTAARDESLATLTRQKSLEALREEYPKIFEQYDIEKLKLEDILNIKRQINEEDSKKTSQRTRDTYYSLRESVSNRSRYLQLFDNPELRKNMSDEDMNIWRMYAGKQSYVEVRDEMKKEAELLNKYQKDVFSDNANSFLGNIKNMNDEDISSALEEITISMKALGNAGKDAMAIVTSIGGEVSLEQLRTIKSALETEQKSRTEKTTYAEDYEQARKDWETAKKELQKIEADKDNFTSKQYEDAKKRVETTEKAYKKLGGLTGTALSKQQKEADKEKKSRQKLSDQLLALQEKNQQAEVNLMKEGTEKKLAQIDADYSAQKAAIARQQRDLAESNKQSGITSTNANGLTTDQQAEIDRANELATESRKKQIEDVYRAEAEAMRSYLAEYGTFQQQKLAISQEYADKIAKAQTNAEKIRLGKERDSKLSGIESNALKANIDWVTVFGEFGGMFSDMIKPVVEDAKKYIQTDEFKNSDASSQQALVEAVNQMEKSLGGAGTLNFKKLGEDVKAYQDALLSLNDAKAQEIEAIEKLKKAQEEYENALKNGAESEKQSAKDALDTAQINANAASENVQAQTSIVSESQRQVSDTSRKLKASMDNVIEGLQKISSGSLTSIYSGLIQAGKGIGGAISKVSESLESVPIIGWIVSIIDVFKDGLSVVVGGILDAVLNAVSGIIGDVLSGNLFVTIGESLVKGLSNIFDALTWGGFSKWVKNGDSDKDLEKDTDRLLESNESLRKSIDNLADKMNESSLKDVNDIYNEQVDKLNQSIANTRELMQRNTSAYSNGFLGIGGTKSTSHRVNDGTSDEDWRRITEIVGRDVDESYDFFSMSPEEMLKVFELAPDLYSKIKSLADDGYKDAAQYMDEYIDYARQMEELDTQRRERLTSTTFDDVRNEFKSTLLDMESDAEDFANNFENMMQNAAIEALMGNFDTQLKSWYDDFAKAMGDDGQLSKSEQEDLRRKYENLVNRGLAERDALMEAMGWDNEESIKEQQSASSRGFGSEMTHEDAGELSGRFTAVYESNLRIETATQQQTVAITELRGSISALTGQAYGMYNIADETRTILANSYLELQQIRENTGEIIKPIKQIQLDIAEVKQNTSRL